MKLPQDARLARVEMSVITQRGWITFGRLAECFRNFHAFFLRVAFRPRCSQIISPVPLPYDATYDQRDFMSSRHATARHRTDRTRASAIGTSRKHLISGSTASPPLEGRSAPAHTQLFIG